jgi:hypothetical protein
MQTLNVWEYEITGGATVRGAMLGFSDRGGTDVSYRFHRLDDDGRPICFDNGGIRMDVLSGAPLKAARRIGNQTI